MYYFTTLFRTKSFHKTLVCAWASLGLVTTFQIVLDIFFVGTNNSRIAKLLRELASFYAKEPDHLFLIRLAQGHFVIFTLKMVVFLGLLYMGQGLITLNPFHSDGAILSKVAAAGNIYILFIFNCGVNLFRICYFLCRFDNSFHCWFGHEKQ